MHHSFPVALFTDVAVSSARCSSCSMSLRRVHCRRIRHRRRPVVPGRRRGHAASSSRTTARPKPGLQIFKDHGYNWVRLRLFHTPDRLPNDLDYTIAAGEGGQEAGLQVPAQLPLFRHLGRPAEAVHPKAWEGNVARRAGRGRVRVHPRHDRRLPRGRRDARHGADRQRSDRRHALARRPAAAELGELCRPAEGRHPRRRGAAAGDAPRAADHDPHRPRRRSRRDQVLSSTTAASTASSTTSSASRTIPGGTAASTTSARTWPSWRTSTRRTSCSSRSPTTGGRPSTATSPARSRKRPRASDFWTR